MSTQSTNLEAHSQAHSQQALKGCNTRCYLQHTCLQTAAGECAIFHVHLRFGAKNCTFTEQVIQSVIYAGMAGLFQESEMCSPVCYTVQRAVKCMASAVSCMPCAAPCSMVWAAGRRLGTECAVGRAQVLEQVKVQHKPQLQLHFTCCCCCCSHSASRSQDC